MYIIANEHDEVMTLQEWSVYLDELRVQEALDRIALAFEIRLNLGEKNESEYV